MNRTFAFSVLLAASLPTSVLAQDVGVFSRSDADAILADPTPSDDEASEARDCPVPLRNGACPRTGDTRGFSIARPGVARPAIAVPKARAPANSARYASPQARKAGTATTSGRSREVPLQFTLGSSELSPQSKANLTTLARALNATEHRGKKILISGHTDRSGSIEANRRLSQQRAEAAAAFLASQGVERGRIEAVGRAFEAPLAGHAVTSPRQRRVEVTRVE